MSKISRRGERNVPFVITKNSVIDSFGYGYGKGSILLDEKTAAFFESKGAGYRENDDRPKVKAAPVTTENTAPKELRELPEDFPGREKLIEAGFNTIEDLLKAEDLPKQLEAIDGIGLATVKKIGLELSENYG